MPALHHLIAKTLVGYPRPLHAEEIRFLRIELNLSQKALAELVGVDVQTWRAEKKGAQLLPVLPMSH